MKQKIIASINGILKSMDFEATIIKKFLIMLIIFSIKMIKIQNQVKDK